MLSGQRHDALHPISQYILNRCIGASLLGIDDGVRSQLHTDKKWLSINWAILLSGKWYYVVTDFMY